MLNAERIVDPNDAHNNATNTDLKSHDYLVSIYFVWCCGQVVVFRNILQMTFGSNIVLHCHGSRKQLLAELSWTCQTW